MYISSGNINQAGNQSISVAPIGNPTIVTRTSRLLQAASTAAFAADREFYDYAGIVISNGYNSNPPNPDAYGKVLRYDGGAFATGSADGWIYNPLGLVTSSNAINFQVFEIDLNNNSGINYGDTPGPTGLGPKTNTGVSVVGAGSNRSTQAVVVGHLGAGWNRGFVSANGVNQVDFTSYSAATYFALDWGNHSDGLVTANANYTGGAAVLTANRHRIDSYNAAGNGRVTIAQVDNFNNLHVGAASGGTNNASNVIVSSPILPRIDNTLVLGGASNRWSSVWSATATIQTSDRSQKKQIEVVKPELAAAFVDRIDPVSYKFITGGMVPVTKIIETLVHETEIIDGIQTLIYDDVPELDARGEPVMLSGLFEVKDEHGALVKRQAGKAEQASDGGVTSGHEVLIEEPVFETRQFPKTKRVPRMVSKPVDQIEYVAREGQRLHFGFVADEFKCVMDDLDIDFGGYVKDAETGQEGLRYGEIIALLWADLKTTKARLAFIEAKLPGAGTA